MSSLELSMLSPLAVYLDETTPNSTIAPRPASLNGKTIGLLPNWRPSAVHILRAIGALLQERYDVKLVEEQPVREIPLRDGKLLDTLHGRLDDLAGRVDAVLTASGD
ncbi:MAG: hypothetical protein IT531_09505 [Burkholderiales bacterium]|nr:hypothetical protein [Burkholderiales bacterium]